MWCIPPKHNAEFVFHMENVLEAYQRPYDPRFLPFDSVMWIRQKL